MHGRTLGPLLVGILGASTPAGALAQSLYDGDTLPRGVGGLIVSPSIGYGPGVFQRFGDGWQVGRESILEDFDGLELSRVLGGNAEGQAGIETVAGGSLGITNFKASQTSIGINFTAAYGITDRLTVAALLPFQWVRYDLDAYLTYPPGAKDISDLKVSEDPSAIRCPGGDFNFGLDDIARLGTRIDGYRFQAGDLQRALTSDCLGYDPIFDRLEPGDDGLFHGRQARTKSGFRDFALGAKYQFFRGRHVRLAALGFAVLGTGKPADPNKLIDFKLGDGNSSVGLLLGATIPLGRVTIGTSAGVEVELPDKERLRLANLSFDDTLETQLATGEISEQELLARVDEGALQPIVTRYDVVETSRKLGNNINVYSYVNVQLLEWLSVGAIFTFLHHFRDRLDDIHQRPDGAAPYPTEAEVRARVQQMVDDGEITDEEGRLEALKAGLSETVERKKAAYGWRTVRGQLALGLGLNFNTLPMFARGDFPVPLIASISISRFFAGQNIDTPDAVQLNLTLPFAFGEVKDPAEWGNDDEGRGPPWP